MDKKNIKSIDTKEFREKFGVVFQNDIVFGDSLKTNIDFYRNLEEEQLHKAVLDAQAKFINNYEEGLEHVVASRGIDLSGGQRQRLLLARSMAAHPDILILDDSSSALDYKTDAAIRKTINEEYSDTTLVVIAQRISSVMNCSKIIILENGKISDMGTHEELLEKSHTYQEIAKLQMGVAHE